MSAESVIETFRKLPTAVAQLPLTEVLRRLLDERIDAHETNPVDQPWEEPRKDILREL